MFYVISYVQLWYHVWYHIWHHGVTRFYRFLSYVISSIFHDIPCDIMPFSLHHMTQETVKSCHTMKSCMKSRKIQWYHHYVISHNCDVTLFCDVRCDITWLTAGWRWLRPPWSQPAQQCRRGTAKKKLHSKKIQLELQVHKPGSAGTIWMSY